MRHLITITKCPKMAYVESAFMYNPGLTSFDHSLILQGYGSASGKSDQKMRLSMYATLAKTLMLEIVILGIVTYFYLPRSEESGKITNFTSL